MAASRRTSKRRLDASSSSQLDRVFFFDRCLGNRDVPDAIRARGLTVEIHADHFQHDAPDSVWIPEVGRRGWIIVTKDKSIRKRYVEIAALLKANVPSFVLTSGETTAQQNAVTILKAINNMIECIRSIAPPFLALVAASGTVSVQWTYGNMLDALDDSR